MGPPWACVEENGCWAISWWQQVHSSGLKANICSLGQDKEIEQSKSDILAAEGKLWRKMCFGAVMCPV